MGLKRIMKKTFLSTTLVMSMMMLTACSSTWDNTHTKAIESLIEQYEKENPNVDIQLEVISNGDY